MSYYCPKCKRNHRPSTKIYKNHLHLKEVEEDEIPSDKIISCDYKSLPSIAKRQILRHIRKIVLGGKRKMYIQEINKVILEETHDNNMLKI